MPRDTCPRAHSHAQVHRRQVLLLLEALARAAARKPRARQVGAVDEDGHQHRRLQRLAPAIGHQTEDELSGHDALRHAEDGHRLLCVRLHHDLVSQRGRRLVGRACPRVAGVARCGGRPASAELVRHAEAPAAEVEPVYTRVELPNQFELRLRLGRVRVPVDGLAAVDRVLHAHRVLVAVKNDKDRHLVQPLDNLLTRQPSAAVHLLLLLSRLLRAGGSNLLFDLPAAHGSRLLAGGGGGRHLLSDSSSDGPRARIFARSAAARCFRIG
eukprot:2137071-Prymnesium_polylepis.1